MTPDAEFADLIRRRFQAVKSARARLLPYVRLLHDSPDAPDDPDRSYYEVAPHHRLIAGHLEKVERGEIRRMVISMPPRHGKTQLVTRSFVPWYLGRNPKNSAIVASYSDDFAGDLGRDIRANIRHPATAQVFPDLTLKNDSRSVSRMATQAGGDLFLVGRGTATTGRGADLIIIDDPIKNRVEADSRTIRDQLWTWYTQVLSSRLMTDRGAIIIVMTRWHEDDLVGRLLDPHNPKYDPNQAAKWTVLDLPALAFAKDPLKRKKGEPLWPTRFGVDYLKDQEAQDPRGFSALYQGRPTPPTGSMFREENLQVYGSLSELPKDLHWYIASDHAVATSQESDLTCMIPAGMDANGTLWISPEVWWQKADTATVVNAMLHLMARFRPLYWWAERGHITKSIGPFLRRAMIEKQIAVALHEVQPVMDKVQRAQSIHGRMSLNMVRFPAFAPWWPDAKRQILQFPYGAKDDFVDTLSLIGLGLQQQAVARAAPKAEQQAPQVGTLAWVKWASDQQRRLSQHSSATSGW